MYRRMTKTVPETRIRDQGLVGYISMASVKEILQSALERAPQERPAFVRAACGEDDHVRLRS